MRSTAPKPDVVIYHGGCPDGWCAAFVAKTRWPDVELRPTMHGQLPPLDAIVDKDVLVVDFSWKRPHMLALQQAAKSVRVLDHHKTAEAELAGLDFCTFDMKKSGATLMWDYLYPDELRPWWVYYTQDRDLWTHALPMTHEVNTYLLALPFTMAGWAPLWTMDVDTAIARGTACKLAVDRYVTGVAHGSRPGMLAGHTCEVVNCQYMHVSDICETILSGKSEDASKPEIAVGWFERADDIMQFSLRSRGDLDVSAIAASFGGGGHRNAAGFSVPYQRGRTILDGMLYRNLAAGE